MATLNAMATRYFGSTKRASDLISSICDRNIFKSRVHYVTRPFSSVGHQRLHVRKINLWQRCKNHKCTAMTSHAIPSSDIEKQGHSFHIPANHMNPDIKNPGEDDLVALAFLCGISKYDVYNWIISTVNVDLEPSSELEKDNKNVTSYRLRKSFLVLLGVADAKAFKKLMPDFNQVQKEMKAITTNPAALQKAKDKSEQLHAELIEREFLSLQLTEPNVPPELSPEAVERLKESVDSRDRKSLYTVIFTKARNLYKKKLNEKIKAMMPERPPRSPDEVAPNKILWRYSDQVLTSPGYHNAYHSQRFGPHLIVDCGLGDYMRKRDIANAMQQIVFGYHYILKETREPFHLHFANFDHSDERWSEALKRLPDMYYTGVTVSSNEVTELYDRKSLVYLTPDAPEVLWKLNPDDTYIVGGLVDKRPGQRVTYTKAKRMRIRMARFPLAEMGNIGRRALNIDAVLKILVDMKDGMTWEVAFHKHLAVRHFVEKEVPH